MLAGQATQKAAMDAKRQLLECAAEVWGVNPEEIEIKDGEAFVKPDTEKRMPFKALARIANLAGGGAVIMGRGYSTFALSMPDFDSGTGNPGEAYSFTAQSTGVEVDMETGQTWCRDMTIAHDCGMPINPMAAESQNEGGAIQGLGQVLYEDFRMDRGETLNPTFLDYKMARSTDVPNIKVIDIITHEPHGIFGAKEASGKYCQLLLLSKCHYDATGFGSECPSPEKIQKRKG
jgi:CO/xanthine dehydrogenase Mo-binding subunit